MQGSSSDDMEQGPCRNHVCLKEMLPFLWVSLARILHPQAVALGRKGRKVCTSFAAPWQNGRTNTGPRKAPGGVAFLQMVQLENASIPQPGHPPAYSPRELIALLLSCYFCLTLTSEVSLILQARSFLRSLLQAELETSSMDCSTQHVRVF